jgi:hypothetical protein
LEKKQEMRDATMAEFTAVHTDMLKRKLRSHRQNEALAKKRNCKFLQSLHEYQKKIQASTGALSGSRHALQKAKMTFADKIEQAYPSWQEQLQKIKIAKLRQLEHEKQDIENRRLLAKQVRHFHQSKD